MYKYLGHLLKSLHLHQLHLFVFEDFLSHQSPQCILYFANFRLDKCAFSCPSSLLISPDLSNILITVSPSLIVSINTLDGNGNLYLCMIINYSRVNPLSMLDTVFDCFSPLWPVNANC